MSEEELTECLVAEHADFGLMQDENEQLKADLKQQLDEAVELRTSLQAAAGLVEELKNKLDESERKLLSHLTATKPPDAISTYDDAAGIVQGALKAGKKTIELAIEWCAIALERGIRLDDRRQSEVNTASDAAINEIRRLREELKKAEARVQDAERRAHVQMIAQSSGRQSQVSGRRRG